MDATSRRPRIFELIDQVIQEQPWGRLPETFTLPYADNWLKVVAHVDGEIDGECINRIDMYKDRACTLLAEEDIDWESFGDSAVWMIFEPIEEEMVKRRARDAALAAEMQRDCAQAVRLAPVFDSIFQAFNR